MLSSRMIASVPAHTSSVRVAGTLPTLARPCCPFLCLVFQSSRAEPCQVTRSTFDLNLCIPRDRCNPLFPLMSWSWVKFDPSPPKGVSSLPGRGEQGFLRHGVACPSLPSPPTAPGRGSAPSTPVEARLVAGFRRPSRMARLHATRR